MTVNKIFSSQRTPREIVNNLVNCNELLWDCDFDNDGDSNKEDAERVSKAFELVRGLFLQDARITSPINDKTYLLREHLQKFREILKYNTLITPQSSLNDEQREQVADKLCDLRLDITQVHETLVEVLAIDYIFIDEFLKAKPEWGNSWEDVEDDDENE